MEQSRTHEEKCQGTTPTRLYRSRRAPCLLSLSVGLSLCAASSIANAKNLEEEPTHVAALEFAAADEASFAIDSYTVRSGDTLWDLARKHGCEIDALREVNNIKGSALWAGQTLRIPTCVSDNESAAERSAKATPSITVMRPVVHAVDGSLVAEPALDPDLALSEGAPTFAEDQMYVVRRGDTLGAIAARYDTSVPALLKDNGLSGTTIFPGQKIRVGAEVEKAIEFILGQSIGDTNGGRLRKATRLPASDDYFIRRPHRAFGAQHTVQYVQRAVSAVKREFPKVHALAIGDLSEREGGKITRHASHQNGRDVDLGFFFKKKPEGYPQSFVVATNKNLDFAASWALLMAFVEAAEEPGGVEKIFMSYSTQRLFYKWARKQGISKAKLGKIFQYPRGRSHAEGLVRHEPGHDEHIHVRFQCPPDDARCH